MEDSLKHVSFDESAAPMEASENRSWQRSDTYVQWAEG